MLDRRRGDSCMYNIARFSRPFVSESNRFSDASHTWLSGCIPFQAIGNTANTVKVHITSEALIPSAVEDQARVGIVAVRHLLCSHANLRQLSKSTMVKTVMRWQQNRLRPVQRPRTILVSLTGLGYTTTLGLFRVLSYFVAVLLRCNRYTPTPAFFFHIF